MKYVSTRGEAKEASFENILASGTASDGGLFVPSVIPKLESAVIDDMKNLSYTEIAEIVIKPFIGDFLQKDELQKIISDAYKNFETNDVVQISKNVKPSHRGELEITSVNQAYLKQQRLKVELMGRGYAWLDTGTHESLMEAGQFIETIEKRQGLKVACLEEIAYYMNYIDAEQVKKLAEPLKKNAYGQYLLNLVKS